ncbi:hypothetical protein LTR32_002633 [Rachicladosporium monterosium]|uniref:Uncharacterized protein n=1 Tax=Rachicladosporium monterosium TaxID=1507873 RepID=A0ABR0LB57_9PEZI|nr:hypothetical protein LTR32_002633 [Rachicladosporium monterosium]
MYRKIIQVEKSIDALDSINAAEVAEEVWRNSWGRWLLSPLYKQAEESREEIEHKDRARQERRVEKDLKERRLESLRSDLRREESSLDAFKKESRAADLRDDQAIRAIETRIGDRAARERMAREMAESERRARIWRQQREQQEKQAQEAREPSGGPSSSGSGAKGGERADSTSSASMKAGGRKSNVVQHFHSALRFGHICCNVRAARLGHVPDAKARYDRCTNAERQI